MCKRWYCTCISIGANLHVIKDIPPHITNKCIQMSFNMPCDDERLSEDVELLEEFTNLTDIGTVYKTRTAGQTTKKYNTHGVQLLLVLVTTTHTSRYPPVGEHNLL
jgi:hypothetical protein